MQKEWSLKTEEFLECYWKDCTDRATQPQLDRDGRRWSSLCGKHHLELEEAIASMEPKRLLKAWVLAQGGAKKATERMLGGK